MLRPTAPLIAPAATIGPWRAIVSWWWTYADGLRPAMLLPSTLGLGLSRRAWRSRLLRRALLLGRTLFFARRPRRTFAAWCDGSERNAAAILIDIDDPDFEHIANADDLVRVAYETVSQAADVDKATIGQADINEHAEIHDVENRAG